MSKIAVLGAGAFGTALALSLAREGKSVLLWARDKSVAEKMNASRMTGPRLPGFELPKTLEVTGDLPGISAEIHLLAVPMKALDSLMRRPEVTSASTLVACMKGMSSAHGQTPSRMIQGCLPDASIAALTGPSFAVDIASGLPTALSLACENDDAGAQLQSFLSTPNLRLYRSTDLLGAELGGALKNVVAIAAGIAIGAGLGDSARAAIIARGMAEMTRIGEALGARAETFSGLSGLGDLVLTATSEKSRNFAAGLAMGSGRALPDVTTEGIETSHAVNALSGRLGVETPIASTISQVVRKEMKVKNAVAALLSRPLKKE